MRDQTLLEIPPVMLLQLPQQPQGAEHAHDANAMPPALVVMINEIFGSNINLMEPEQLAKRAILTPTVKETMQVNNFIISYLNGPLHQYFSSDSLESDDANMHMNYPVEFLNQQQPSGSIK